MHCEMRSFNFDFAFSEDEDKGEVDLAVDTFMGKRLLFGLALSAWRARMATLITHYSTVAQVYGHADQILAPVHGHWPSYIHRPY
jgi:hypothetical protein